MMGFICCQMFVGFNVLSQFYWSDELDYFCVKGSLTLLHKGQKTAALTGETSVFCISQQVLNIKINVAIAVVFYQLFKEGHLLCV